MLLYNPLRGEGPVLALVDVAVWVHCEEGTHALPLWVDHGEGSRGSWRACDYEEILISLQQSTVSHGSLLSNLVQVASEPPMSVSVSLKSGGVTSAILLSDLFQGRLPNTVTMDSIHEKSFLSTNSVLEAVVLDVFLLPGTDIYMLNLGDLWSSNTIEIYLHRRYYNLVDLDHGILKQGREIFLTGCCLRTAAEGPGHTRLLPTDYMVVLLDEDQDDDAMLLGAQFCSDSFSSVSLDAIQSLFEWVRVIESIGPLEVQEKFGSLQRKQITLIDNDGFKLKFLLWGEQVLLANFFSIGSMVALDRPYIANAVDCSIETSEEICLEYGSATQLYMVPFLQHKEQVMLASTQSRYQGSLLATSLDQTQSCKPSQVSLPCDSQGSINFSNYPFRIFVADLHNKMTGISLYGVVTKIYRERHTNDTVFSLTIEDTTGAIVVKLHFIRSWSFGRLGSGHTIFISGLTCSMTKTNRLKVEWFEKIDGASLVNLSCLPAILNSSCLHQLSHLSELSNKTNMTCICSVRLDQVEHHHVTARFTHATCGNFVGEGSDGSVLCDFCRCTCHSETVHSFHLKVTIADESTKLTAWCSCQTATEILQISPDEFYALPEDEQAMYLYTLENERYMVAIVHCKVGVDELGSSLDQGNDLFTREIARAMKCD
ncbi:hypothetical protein QJS10_CPB17g01057 [Acorus calamus]|uniref:Cell division control protein 24 OB domain-containing protein n=1 Tax=Acorus calamus TaxID=4465 RepID=A0AAV9CWG2_ACOCL|nr:hypothetical protein QJS10_CPB17g01057 [Acorus calamus]